MSEASLKKPDKLERLDYPVGAPIPTRCVAPTKISVYFRVFPCDLKKLCSIFVDFLRPSGSKPDKLERLDYPVGAQLGASHRLKISVYLCVFPCDLKKLCSIFADLLDYPRRGPQYISVRRTDTKISAFSAFYVKFLTKLHI